MNESERYVFGFMARALLVVFVVVVLIIGSAWAFRYFTADVRGRIDAEEQITSGSSRIARYEYFFELCAAVQTNEAQLDALQLQLESTDDPKVRDRLQTNITGVTAARANAVNQYNAEATKSYTSARFHDSDLPYQLDPNYQGVRTTCAAP